MLTIDSPRKYVSFMSPIDTGVLRNCVSECAIMDTTTTSTIFCRILEL